MLRPRFIPITIAFLLLSGCTSTRNEGPSAFDPPTRPPITEAKATPTASLTETKRTDMLHMANGVSQMVGILKACGTYTDEDKEKAAKILIQFMRLYNAKSLQDKIVETYVDGMLEYHKPSKSNKCKAEKDARQILNGLLISYLEIR